MIQTAADITTKHGQWCKQKLISQQNMDNDTSRSWYHNKTWVSYQILKIAGCACAGNTGNVFPAPIVSYPAMTERTWPLSDKKPMGFLSDSGHARAVMQAGIANPQRWGRRSRHSRRMRNPYFYGSDKRPMDNDTSSNRYRNKTWTMIQAAADITTKHGQWYKQ